MSERPAEVKPAKPTKPRDSAVGIVIRPADGGGWQVLLGKRARQSKFLPGAWAFIGGGLEPTDEPERHGAHARCVSREVLEETGIYIPSENWLEAGIRVTPPVFPVRYSTRFFLAPAPEDTQIPEHPPRPEELEELVFVSAARALVQWETGEANIPPVLPPILRLLADSRKRSINRLAAKLREIHELEEQYPRIEFSPGLWLIPVRSDTLPPATHTNVWLIGGKKFIVLDPGTKDSSELERLFGVIDRRLERGHKVEAVVVTHHHKDHAAGAKAVAERLGVPVRAHAETIERMSLDGVEAKPLDDGDILDLAGMSLRVMFTPGHAPGHIALYSPEVDVVFIGDLLSGFSTILIDPDDGDMGQYIASLRKIDDLRCRTLYPGHGLPLQPTQIEKTIEHRWGREASLLASMSADVRPIKQIVEDAYRDAPKVPLALKKRQALAHLQHMEKKGLVAQDGEGWKLNPPA